mmetsp:Transcript_26435/g.32052  ORF Transcript_26435/g.32052 Transcript_26435/m.32052 type:complete len:94 (-) Transcript_26435:692-973(-)
MIQVYPSAIHVYVQHLLKRHLAVPEHLLKCHLAAPVYVIKKEKASHCEIEHLYRRQPQLTNMCAYSYTSPRIHYTESSNHIQAPVCKEVRPCG